jgi:hypothetical protein
MLDLGIFLLENSAKAPKKPKTCLGGRRGWGKGVGGSNRKVENLETSFHRHWHNTTIGTEGTHTRHIW